MWPLLSGLRDGSGLSLSVAVHHWASRPERGGSDKKSPIYYLPMENFPCQSTKVVDSIPDEPFTRIFCVKSLCNGVGTHPIA